MRDLITTLDNMKSLLNNIYGDNLLFKKELENLDLIREYLTTHKVEINDFIESEKKQ